MNDLASYLDFAFEIVCMIAPIDEVEFISVTPNQALIVGIAAMMATVFALILQPLRTVFSEHGPLVPVVAICVTALAFVSMNFDVMKALFVTGYPPMVIGLRCCEGALIGSRVPTGLRLWQLALFIPGFAAVVAVIYVLISPLPQDVVAVIQCVWALGGAVAAAWLWSRSLSGTPPFDSSITIIALAVLFASTILYVSTAPLDAALYKWGLPLGFVVGVVGRRASAAEQNGD